MKRLIARWKANSEESAKRRAEKEAAREEEEKKATDAMQQRFLECCHSMTEAGFRRLLPNVHRMDDNSSCGGYLLGPDQRVYLLSVHRRGAAHIKPV